MNKLRNQSKDSTFTTMTIAEITDAITVYKW